MSDNPRRAAIAIVTIVVLAIVSNAHAILVRFSSYRWLHANRPFYLAESIDKIGGALLCVLAIAAIYRAGPGGIARRLVLAAPVLPAIGFALAASSPMLIGFAATRTTAPQFNFPALLFLTVFSPIVEEVEFRGFGVLQLQRGTGWPFWLVVWPSVILFGYGHIEQGATAEEMLGLFLLTGAGALIFAWVAHRWQNLWFAVALHICMNLWWGLFSVARTAIGGWFPFAMQTLTMVLAIAITIYRAPGAVAATGAPAGQR